MPNQSDPASPPDAARSTAAPLVIEEDGRLRLEFSQGSVQSEMLLARPDALALDYTRAMMAFALFVPRPRNILMVGLGGGSLAKFCYRHFPHARITVIELRADVIALRARFKVPPDDARFRVIHADACHVLPSMRASADVLIVDGFNEAGLPSALGTPRFYGHCRRALEDGGVLVQNIFSYDPAYGPMLARLRLMFDDRVCWFDRVAGNNRILFALKVAPALPASRALRLQRAIARHHGLPFTWMNVWLIRGLIAYLGSIANPAKRMGSTEI